MMATKRPRGASGRPLQAPRSPQSPSVAAPTPPASPQTSWGRVGNFVDVHITRAQKVAALAVSLITLVGASIAGIHWLVDRPSVTPPQGQSGTTNGATDPGDSTTKGIAGAPDKPANPDPYLGSWGPARETFTIQRPATYAVINSITDNPAYGDERNFVQIKHVHDSNATYSEMLRANVGDILQVYVTVANDCADNFADASPSALQGLTAQLATSAVGTDLPIGVILAAKNSARVWDGATVITRMPARLRAVPGSAFMRTAFGSGGFALDDSGFVNGEPMLLGQERQDGQFAVGRNGTKEAGAGFLTFRLQVDPA